MRRMVKREKGFARKTYQPDFLMHSLLEGGHTGNGCIMYRNNFFLVARILAVGSTQRIVGFKMCKMLHVSI